MWDCAHSQSVGFCRPAGRHHQQASRDKAHQRPSHEPDRRRCFYNRAISRNQWLSEGPTVPPGLLFRSDFPSPGEGSREWLHESQAGWCHPRGTALGHWPIRRQEFMSDCRPVAHSSPVLCRVPTWFTKCPETSFTVSLEKVLPATSDRRLLVADLENPHALKCACNAPAQNHHPSPTKAIAESVANRIAE